MQGTRRRFGLTVALAFCAWAQTALASNPSGLELLTQLRQGIDAARALPKGSRPAPPKADLSRLMGTTKADVKRILGPPNFRGHDESWSDTGANCAGTSSWRYSWGPPPPETHAGPDYVEVITGGPWLLVIEFSSNVVAAARWQGQR
jgi:hypothetical protein